MENKMETSGMIGVNSGIILGLHPHKLLETLPASENLSQDGLKEAEGQRLEAICRRLCDALDSWVLDRGLLGLNRAY